MPNKISVQTKKAKPTNKSVSLPRSMGSLVPEKFQTTLKYCDYGTLDPAAGAFSTVVYSPSSLYDPYVPAGGHQPMGFDQFAALYAHYVVDTCAINVKVFPTTSQTVPAAIGVTLTHDNGLTGPWNAQIEQPSHLCVYKAFIGPLLGSFPNTMNIVYDAKKMSGLTKSALYDSDLSSSVATNPVDMFYAILWTQAIDLSADITAIHFIIELSFNAVFFTRKTLAQS
jgi:hypothetical protein